MSYPREISQQMLDFIESSPSCYHAVHNLAGMLEREGFSPLEESACWTLAPGRGYYTTRNGSSLIAFRIPEPAEGGFLIAAAHSDSPAFKLKRRPELKSKHYLRLNVEKYGGAILSSWLDRPLSIAGRVAVRDRDCVEQRLVNVDRDLVLIPNVAIHMSRPASENAALNPQIDLLPLLGQSEPEGTLDKLIAKNAGTEPGAVLDSDLFLYLRERGRIWGAQEEFLSSPRLDDLQCAWACVRGLIEANTPQAIPVCAVFDNEEVGSTTKQGADSTFLQDTLERISECLGRSRQEHRAALASSLMVSVDNGHAVHPNHPEKSDEANYPQMNQGVVIKYSANQKYTTDAVSAALFQTICQNAEVPTQVYLNRSDMPGGSTLGNISNAHVSLPTVDVGLAQLAMHSPFETAGVQDTAYLLRALAGLYRTKLLCVGPGRWKVLA